MVNSTVHVTVGLLVASAFALPPVLAAWRARRPLSRPIGVWLLASLTLGILTTVPSLLRRAGLPDAACDSGWMNIFVFYPTLNHLLHGGTVWGPAILALAVGFQYLILLAAIHRQAQR